MDKIPIAKPFLGEEEANAAKDTILSGWVSQGPKVEQFENDFAAYVGSDYAVAVSNCTAALHLSLVVSDIKQGDEVICPSMSFIATANSIIHAGAKPVFAEVDSQFNLDLNDVKSKVTSRTKAIVLVHQIGYPADIKEFKEFCEDNNLVLIEDAACAIGSEYHGKKIGSHSDLVCFSFHPRKVITTGDGGMISTSNKEFATKLRLLRQHGMNVNDRVRHESKTVIFEEYPIVGYNYRMTDIQASVGIEQMKKIDAIIIERRNIAKKYIQCLSEVVGISMQHDENEKITNYQSFAITLNDDCSQSRDDLMNLLLTEGITTRRGVMTCHREEAYRSYDVDLPKTEYFSDNSILIPLYNGMTSVQIDRVIEALLRRLS